MLAGGGNAVDSAPIDRRFAAWIARGEPLLYLPIAMRWSEADYAKAYDWLVSVFNPLGVDTIEMWTDFEGHAPSELACYAAVYIGGGNTYYLLQELRRSGLEEGLIHFVRDGGAIYGGSAGAAVLGRDIATIAHLDRNDVGLARTAGLDVALGHAVWVHYTEADDPLIERYIAETGQGLFVLSERSGIAIEGEQAWSVGREPALVADQTGWRELPGPEPPRRPSLSLKG
jgi:dipeptidase E